MDSVCDCLKPLDPEQIVSRSIDRQIKSGKREIRRTTKLLLLGSGEAGKSTMVKQMKILHDNGFSVAKRKTFIPHIHSNLFEAIIRLVNARKKFGFTLEKRENGENEELLLSVKPESLETPILLPPEIFAAISILWEDAGIQKTFTKRKELQLNDSVEYFMNRLNRIREENFVPDQDDVLRVRVRTTSIIEYPFVMGNRKFRIVDVGGQRTQRRKWIHCFEGVSFIFYVASLSDYNNTLMEDNKVNRMKESLSLFRVILQEKLFEDSAIILFLNKTDLFEEDIQKFHLKDYFPEYQGSRQNAESAREFILEMYKKCNPNKYRPVYHHFTCCVDTRQFEQVFNIVRFNIIDKAIKEGAAV